VLRLSNRGRYAVRAVFDLAQHAGGPVQVRDVAARQRIPLRFLEQILQALKRAGLVESKRGPRGGFTLAQRADAIRLGDVLRAVEGPVVLGASTNGRARAGDVTEAALAELSASVERCFDGVTFEDLCARGERVAVQRRRAASFII
jgi:Rrf2 family protein